MFLHYLLQNLILLVMQSSVLSTAFHSLPELNNANGCYHCQHPWMTGSQRGSAASQHLHLWPGSWYNNKICRLVFTQSRDLQDPAVPEAMLAHHDWWRRLVHIQTQPGTTAQHISLYWNNKLHLWWVPEGPWDIVIMMQQKQMKNEMHFPLVFLLPHRGQCRTHDWLCSANYQLRPWNTMRLYYTATHCMRGVLFFFLLEVKKMRTGSVCRPGNAFPSEIPNMRQTNILPTIH